MIRDGKVLPVGLRNATAIISVVLCFLPSKVFATIIDFDVTSLGGNQYRYDYTVTNDTLGASLELFDIHFDPALYLESSLNIVTGPPLASDWSEAILTSAPGFAAFYDVFALAGGIAAGDTLAGFSVEFDWLGGPGGPGAQTFEVFDPLTFGLLETGVTTAQAVPEPATLWLAGVGLLGLLGSSMIRSRCSRAR